MPERTERDERIAVGSGLPIYGFVVDDVVEFKSGHFATEPFGRDTIIVLRLQCEVDWLLWVDIGEDRLSHKRRLGGEDGYLASRWDAP